MNDVFISYAHIDDQALTEGQKGWITQFHRILDLRLGQLLGEKPTIWRDQKLQGGDVFDDKIVNAFRDAKVMISIMSPRYMKSEWCLKELNEFYKAASDGGNIKVGEKARIFKVIKTPIDARDIPEHIPQVLQSILGFEFFDFDPDTGRLVEYDEAFGERARQNYFSRIYDLAYEICDLLKNYQSGAPGVLPAAPASKADGKTIYLATTSSDLQVERDRIKRELTERGHRVLPDTHIPLIGPELEGYLNEVLPNCDLAIHMVGARYGMIPEDAQCSVSELQNRLAAQHSEAKGLERIIWMPRGLIAGDERQIDFLRRLNEDEQCQYGAEVIEESLDSLKSYVLDSLKPKPKPEPAQDPAAAPTATTGSNAKSVYLICDAQDEEAIEPLEDYLFDQGFEVSLPLFEGEESLIAQSHRQKLTLCDAVLVYYGAGGRSWIEMKLMDLMQAPGFGRENPFLTKAVLVAPPEDRRKSRFKTHLADILTQSGEFDPACLESFVNQIKA
ncbi:MAG: TIR domain-containing protein [Verrucomicrobiae bacterium]|nr:TIR domain-containing protein [Verrucomicrobiae bacterium]